MTYSTVELSVDSSIAAVRLNRPERANALNRALWDELRLAFKAVDAMADVRVVVLTGAGAHFSGGIDLDMLASMQGTSHQASADRGRVAEALRRYILDLQDVFNCVEQCRVPVIAAISGACIGAGVDLATACDLRYSTRDAKFCVKEIDMAIVADIGAVQRLPHIVGGGRARELIYTGRTITGAEAEAIGLVNRAFESAEVLQAEVSAVARELASKSPLTLRGCKQTILYSRDHTVAEGLEHVALWNAGAVMSEDLLEAIRAQQEKRKPKFRD
jgi:enoyl-CoA hydratase